MTPSRRSVASGDERDYAFLDPVPYASLSKSTSPVPTPGRIGLGGKGGDPRTPTRTVANNLTGLKPPEDDSPDMSGARSLNDCGKRFSGVEEVQQTVPVERGEGLKLVPEPLML